MHCSASTSLAMPRSGATTPLSPARAKWYAAAASAGERTRLTPTAACRLAGLTITGPPSRASMAMTASGPSTRSEIGLGTPAAADTRRNRDLWCITCAAPGPAFGRPSRSASYFSRLWDEGKLAEIETGVYYCPVDDAYLYEAEVRGNCHYCKAPADGFYCEECGRPQESGGLLDAVCTRCGTAPERRIQRRISFPLQAYRDQLVEYYAELPMRPRLRAFLDMMFAGGLPDTPISRAGSYGVAVPLPEWSGHHLDTWFCGVWGYVAATAGAHRVANRGAGQQAWSAQNTEVHEFLGFDCSFSHAILWPALCLALGDVPLPAGVNTNEFYKLEGGKFSTSRGYAIWGGEFLNQVPADSLRFYLCLTGPETEQTNFTMTDFSKRVAETLVEGLEVVLRSFDDSASAAAGDGGAGSDKLDAIVAQLRAQVGAHLSPRAFSPAAAAAAIGQFCTDQQAIVNDAAASGPARRGDRRWSAWPGRWSRPCPAGRGMC